jgi:hypothetical protein
MVHIIEGTDIRNDTGDKNIQAWLKSLGKTMDPKKAVTFSREDVRKYLIKNSENIMTLPARLLLHLGCNVGCRCHTLYKLEFRHIELTTDGNMRVMVDFTQKHDQRAHGQTWLVQKNMEDLMLCPTTLFLSYKSIAAAANLATGYLWKKLYMVRGNIKMKNMRLGENWVSGVARKVA